VAAAAVVVAAASADHVLNAADFAKDLRDRWATVT
jgi:hypothetical protein